MNPIYKTKFNHHIDLSKILSVSNTYSNEINYVFSIMFQQMNEPVEYIFTHKELMSLNILTFDMDDLDYSSLEAMKIILKDIIEKWKEYNEIQHNNT
jgi:hypothetical protein